MRYKPPTPSELRCFHPERALDWHDYADAWLSFPLGRLLDYGCNTGGFLARLAERCDEGWGADIDPDVLETAAKVVDGRVRRVIPGRPLPFADGFFDTVVSLEVIEHVPDERALLAELTRVLHPGGHLLLTTPHRGLLTFLDPGNFKFIAPSLHRFFHVTLLGREEYYRQRFGDQRRREHGLIADFSIAQTPWHRHYRYRQVRACAAPELETVAWAAYYPAFRALSALKLAIRVVTHGRVADHLPPMRWMRRHLSRCQTTLGDQLVVLMRKRAP